MTEDNRPGSGDANTRKVDDATSDKNTPSSTPKQIGNFKIEGLLGEGGMGAVYRAYDGSMKRTVALKVLHPSLEISKSTQMRFVREAWIAGQLDHPNIVKVYTRGEDKGTSYIAMEFVEGGSLADFIHKKAEATAPPGQQSEDTVSGLYIRGIVAKFIGLAEALEHVHSKGFIHRDIKPLNILIAIKDDAFKLTDFGIAHAEDMTKITRAGDFMGTVHYMSPELLTAHRSLVDKRTDIYSLGVTLYEALTLCLPFEADSEERLITEILTGHSISARQRNRKIPFDLETILMKAVHQDAGRRYQSAQEFAEDLRRFLEQKPVFARRESVASRAIKYVKRHRKLLLAVATTMLIAAAFFWYSQWHQSELNRQRSEAADYSQIWRTLSRAVETRQSPFSLDPDWSRLSNILLARLNRLSNPHDSLFLLVLRAGNYPKLFIDKIMLRDRVNFSYSIGAIELFDSTGIRRQRELNLEKQSKVFCGSVVSELDLLVDNGVYKHLRTVSGTYKVSWRTYLGGIYFAGTGPGTGKEFMRELPDGWHTFNLRAISKYYVNARLFERTDSSVARKISNDSLATGNDSLEETAINYGNGEVLVLDANTRHPVEPILVDTTCDTASILIMKEYGPDFPSAVHKPQLSSWYRDSSAIREFIIIKWSPKQGTWYDHLFVEKWRDDIPFPIAARFVVRSNNSRAILLTGYFCRNYHMNVYYNVDYVDESPIGNFLARQSDTASSGPHLEDMGENTSRFPALVKLGRIRATLELVPSRKVAVTFACINGYWGDTITYDIWFQAIDSVLNVRRSDL